MHAHSHADANGDGQYLRELRLTLSPQHAAETVSLRCLSLLTRLQLLSVRGVALAPAAFTMQVLPRLGALRELEVTFYDTAAALPTFLRRLPLARLPHLSALSLCSGTRQLCFANRAGMLLAAQTPRRRKAPLPLEPRAAPAAAAAPPHQLFVVGATQPRKRARKQALVG